MAKRNVVNFFVSITDKNNGIKLPRPFVAVEKVQENRWALFYLHKDQTFLIFTCSRICPAIEPRAEPSAFKKDDGVKCNRVINTPRGTKNISVGKTQQPCGAEYNLCQIMRGPLCYFGAQINDNAQCAPESRRLTNKLCKKARNSQPWRGRFEIAEGAGRLPGTNLRKVVDSALTHARFSPEGDGGSGSPFTLRSGRWGPFLARASPRPATDKPTTHRLLLLFTFPLGARARSLSLLLAATYKVSWLRPPSASHSLHSNCNAHSPLLHPLERTSNRSPCR